MSYKIQRIILNNLKFISDKKHEDINFESADLVILNGPNGYGKSTVFDAIELLITGDIKHFNDELLNKGTLSKSILANNSNENVIISSILVDEENNQFSLKRTFVCNDKFDSIIEWQENKISQEKLYEILQINENLFDIGIYISQSESLKFFEQKYKDRKTLISGILDDSESYRKKEKLIGFDNKLKAKKDELLVEGKKKLEDIKKKKEEIDLIMKKVGNISDEVGYVKLFDTDYDFDQENIKFSLEYDLYTAPLKEIKQFNLEYDKYEKSKHFYILNKIQKFNDNDLKSIIYKNLIF